MGMNKIKVLLVEDSPLQQEFLKQILEADPCIDIIKIVSNGEEAIEALKVLSPQIVLMDLHMPRMNGVDATRHIMATKPLPIVAISASDSHDEIINGFHALEAGAIAFVRKPTSTQSPDFQAQYEHLVQTLKLMSEIKVIRREAAIKDKFGRGALANQPPSIDIIGIGASTGGPLVLQTIISLLPKEFPPVLIVQHITPGFVEGLADWLQNSTHRHVEVAKHHHPLERNHVYLAPNHHQMGVSSDHRIILLPPNDEKICPSANFLFRSILSVFKHNAMGILLTGMGGDGATELKNMKDKGAVTIAQNKDSCLIFGMPAQAIALNAATYVLSPEEIAQLIIHLTQ